MKTIIIGVAGETGSGSYYWGNFNLAEWNIEKSYGY